MDELVFCCPKCLEISHVGCAADARSVHGSMRRLIVATCEHCHQTSTVPGKDVLFSNALGSDGVFAASGIGP